MRLFPDINRPGYVPAGRLSGFGWPNLLAYCNTVELSFHQPVVPFAQLSRARDLANAAFHRPLTVDELAAEAGLSKYLLIRLVDRAFSTTPYRHLHELRRIAPLLRREYTLNMSVFVDGKTKLTYEEYRLFPDDGRRHEIIDGEHYVSPSPNTNHQSTSRHIQFALYEQLEKPGLGYVFNAPMDLELAPTDVVQPDLIVVLAENREIILPSRLRGVPDLVVEILSPSTGEMDRTLKRSLYETHRVPEYWLVDVEERCILRYALGAAGYGEPQTHCDEISFSKATVDLKAVWARL